MDVFTPGDSDFIIDKRVPFIQQVNQYIQHTLCQTQVILILYAQFTSDSRHLESTKRSLAMHRVVRVHPRTEIEWTSMCRMY